MSPFSHLNNLRNALTGTKQTVGQIPHFSMLTLKEEFYHHLYPPAFQLVRENSAFNPPTPQGSIKCY